MANIVFAKDYNRSLLIKQEKNLSSRCKRCKFKRNGLRCKNCRFSLKEEVNPASIHALHVSKSGPWSK